MYLVLVTSTKVLSTLSQAVSYAAQRECKSGSRGKSPQLEPSHTHSWHQAPESFISSTGFHYLEFPCFSFLHPYHECLIIFVSVTMFTVVVRCDVLGGVQPGENPLPNHFQRRNAGVLGAGSSPQATSPLPTLTVSYGVLVLLNFWRSTKATEHAQFIILPWIELLSMLRRPCTFCSGVAKTYTRLNEGHYLSCLSFPSLPSPKTFLST